MRHQDSAVIGHLLCDDFNFIDRPRPRTAADELSQSASAESSLAVISVV
jgi:hypothetical protein